MSALREILGRNLAGEPVGLPSWCTAHGDTLRAVLSTYRACDRPILIEATCNQVNQEGGYTGMTPAGFRRFLTDLARHEGIAFDRIILGGDHLGPNPWKAGSADAAMDKARAMVAAYVEAGFTKIHLDASMPCADDEALSEDTMAARAADLARVAEAAAAGRPLDYVIGTEVPAPGGETGDTHDAAVTDPAALRVTLEAHRAAFTARGLGAAFERVAAVVVRSGADFSNEAVEPFDPDATVALATVSSAEGPAFEAHSTDYQTAEALRAMVASRFAILKVGPELTHAYREAVMTLARLADEAGIASDIPEALLAAMRDDPSQWRAHVAPGPGLEARLLGGYADRVRYYWGRPTVSGAVADLLDKVRSLPDGPAGATTGSRAAPAAGAEALIRSLIGAVVRRYRFACGDAACP